MTKVIRKKVAPLPMAPIDYSELPKFTGDDFKKRIETAFKKTDYSHILVYADREHASNVEFFTGYDPRFEECLLILSRDGKNAIVAGDEGITYATKIPFDIDILCYPTFSLPGQPKDAAVALQDILKNYGLNQQSKVGIIGWKYFDRYDFADYQHTYDLPCFIMDEILAVVSKANISNAIELMAGNEDGLRIFLDAKELILGEIAGTKSSRNTYNVISNLKPGITELEASMYLNIDGDPVNVYPNINFGENLFFALASPALRPLKDGDLVGAGMAFKRSLCHKISYYVSKGDLSARAEELYDTYFLAVAKWYEAIKIGVTGKEVYEAVLSVVGDYKKAGIALNPGHLIHTDEWSNTPFNADCQAKIRSGMLIQCDFTSALKDENFAVHAEDGIIVADSALQKEMEAMAPKAYARMKLRQKFMREELGIQIDDCILPTSDMPAIVYPYLKELDYVLAIEK